MALIPQDPMSSLNPTTKIGRQIGEGLRIHEGASDEEARKRALEVLEMVEMPRPAERLDQYPFELSGGLRQRVIIAMGLVCRPKLLIADEPTTALDVTIQAQILDIIDNLRSELNMGVLLITHDMGVIAGRTDRVVVMYGGKKAEEASTVELFDSMHHPYTQALLASMPNLENTTKHELASIAGHAAGPHQGDRRLSVRAAVRLRHRTSVATRIRQLTVEDGHAYACFLPVDGPRPVAFAAPARGRRAIGSQGDRSASRTWSRSSRSRRESFATRSAPCTPCRTSAFRSTRARPSVSSVSRAAARRRSDECWSASKRLTSGEILFDDKVVSAQDTSRRAPTTANAR